MNSFKAIVGAVALLVSPAVRSAVVVEQVPVTELLTNKISNGTFSSAPVGAPPPKPWLCSKSTENAHVAVETPAGRPEAERWVRLVDNSDKDNANIRQSVAPITSGRFQIRLISNKDGGRLFFNLGTGAASKPEERALQLSIDTDGSLVARSEHNHKTSSQIKTGAVYLVRCDFDRVHDGKTLRIRAELVEESSQNQSRVETEVGTPMPISTVRVTSTKTDTGVDYYVTDVSLTDR